jgi:pimeloyl-ACP methyl ester carboxylesterase
VAAFGVLLLVAGLASAAGPAGASATIGEQVRTYTGEIDGAAYRVQVPTRWNGILVLYSHGDYGAAYIPPPDQINLANRPATAQWLIQHGYALAASNYRTPSFYAVKEALSDQVALLDWFGAHIGTPRRTISAGGSMGGLIAILLAERNPQRFDGVVAMCGADAGGLGQWNTALDLTFALKTLLAPGSALELVHITRPGADLATISGLVQAALTTPQGRARLALANALADVPGWFHALEPRPTDVESQIRQQAQADVIGLFPIIGAYGRADLERRAGGDPSWNTGVDYRRQLAHSSQRTLVQQAYRLAGMDPEADLQRLADTPRISADAPAVAWLSRYGTPRGDAARPVVTLQGVSDFAGITQSARWYAQQVRRHAAAANLRQLFVDRAGHCMFTAAEEVVALQTLRTRLDTGRWGATRPATLNATAAGFDPAYQQVYDWITGTNGTATPAFTRYTPGLYLRPSPSTTADG